MEALMEQAEIKTYTKPQIGLHNLMALLIIGLYLFGLALESFDKSVRPDYINIHKLGGLAVIALLAIRFASRLITPPPAMPATMGPLFVKLAHLGHYALYVLMAVVPLSGVFMSLYAGRGLNLYFMQVASPLVENKPLAHTLHEVHEVGANVLAALVVGHVLFALYHQFVLKDDLLYRLSPRGK